MNGEYESWKSIAIILIGIVVTIIGWFASDTRAETRRNRELIEQLRNCMVTRDELNSILARQELVGDKQHQENQRSLFKMQETIEANEERSAKTRHDTNETVHALAMQLAVFSRQDRRDER